MTTDFNLLRARLESEHKRLTEELKQLQACIRPVEERREGSPFGKREEEATEAAELEKRLALEKQIEDRLTEVEHALHKFDSGTYGFCDNCGQPIDPARLEALPQASLCVNCKAHPKPDGSNMPRNIIKGGDQRVKETKVQAWREVRRGGQDKKEGKNFLEKEASQRL